MSFIKIIFCNKIGVWIEEKDFLWYTRFPINKETLVTRVLLIAFFDVIIVSILPKMGTFRSIYSISYKRGAVLN